MKSKMDVMVDRFLMMTPLKIADEMESFARDGVRPDDALLREWAKHLRSSEADQRDAVLEEAAVIADDMLREVAAGALVGRAIRHLKSQSDIHSESGGTR